MNGRAVLFSTTVCLIIAAGVDAQFIGDALAAAGVAATEQQAVAAVGSVRGASAPKTGSAHESSAPQGAKVYEPSTVGTDVGPLGAATVFAAGKPYIYYYGTFYLYDGADRAYVVVAPPAGALIDYLPDTAKKVEWKGATHYAYAGTYYKPYYRGSSLVFEVAGQG